METQATSEDVSLLAEVLNRIYTCKSSLFMRRMVLVSTCSRCQQASESPLHATFQCPLCVALLEKASFFSKKSHGTWNSLIDLMEEVRRVLTVDELKLLVVIM